MKSMLGAVMNDTYLMKNRMVMFYLLGILGILGAYLTTGNPEFRTLLMSGILLVIPIASLESTSVSFSSRWQSFERAWSISPHLMVLSRYILYLILSVIGVGVWMISPFYDGNTQSLVYSLLLAQLICIVYYPIMYFLNPKKGSIGQIALMAAFGISFSLSDNVILRFANGNYGLIVILVIALYLVSIVFSMIFNMIHRGKA